MKTPAVTIVAAWMRAEIGVGPSMASGSQTCSGNCADLPTAPVKSKRQMSVRTETSRLPPNGLKNIHRRSGRFMARVGEDLAIVQ